MGEGLPTIPGTPGIVDMSGSSSPQPGGWSSPGLSTPYDNSGRNSPYANGSSSHNVTWASAQARSAEVKGYPAFTTRGQGFFGKHFRKLSMGLPFNQGDKEKLGRGRAQDNKLTRILNGLVWNLWRLRKRVAIVFLIIFLLFFGNFNTRKLKHLAFYSQATGIDICSHTSSVQTIRVVRRRQQICCYPCRESRRRCHGMERSP